MASQFILGALEAQQIATETVKIDLLTVSVIFWTERGAQPEYKSDVPLDCGHLGRFDDFFMYSMWRTSGSSEWYICAFLDLIV